MSRSRTAALPLVCLLAIAGLALSGCGDDDSTPAATTMPAPTEPPTAPAATPTSGVEDTATHTATAPPPPSATATPPPTGTSTTVPTATATPTTADPGADAWIPVPTDEVAARCGLDPALLAAADPLVDRPYVVVRHGQLCHEYYPGAELDPTEEIYSTTKTLGALVTGVAAYRTRDLPRSGRKTGPIGDEDRIDHWLDEFSFNPDARIAHVLAMLGHNEDLSFGNRSHMYDTAGTVQINRLSDVINTALEQDPERLGANLEEFTQRYLFAPLGMRNSVWTHRSPDKLLGFTWHSTVRDMARVGLLMLRDGMWSGERLLDASWVYKMTHPSFEDANTGYGYLTWLNSDSNWTLGLGDGIHGERSDPCSPVALHEQYPHGLSESPDCNYEPPYTCEQMFDVGLWYAAGAFGQYIVGHRGLDLVLAVKHYDGGPRGIWAAVRPALVALDPTFQGDEDAFCAQYAAGAYAPDLP
jgi:hypothetical protein